MMAGMGVVGILFLTLVLLSIAALAKYFFVAKPRI